MIIRQRIALAVLLAALRVSANAQEAAKAPETPPPDAQGPGFHEVVIGARSLHVTGNEDMYRSQINEGSGLQLQSLTIVANDAGGSSWRWLDRLRVDASELGAGPAGALRIAADKSGLYRFRLGYRRTNEFSALPAFANPLLDRGVMPGQHTDDRTRHSLDADLEFLPASRVTPFIGFSLQRWSGPGTTTYALGGDEFRLSQELTARDRELRVGTGWNIGWLYGSVTQGWRRSRSTERLSLAPGDANGNNGDPVLGRPVLANGITRVDRTDVDTPFTNLFVTALGGARLRVTADYVRFAADSTGDVAEDASGSFLSFALGRFFNGTSGTGTSSAKNTTWRGGGRAEVTLRDGVTAFAGYRKEHRDLDGSALITTLDLQTLTFGGIDPRDVQTILDAKSSIDRDETAVHAGVAARLLGPLSVRLEVRQTDDRMEVAPDLSEIVVPGGQSGIFDRRIRTLDANATDAKSAFTLGAAYRHDDADAPIFRTDFGDRDRVRLRAAWKAPKWLRAGVVAEETKQSNDQPGILLDGKARQTSGDVEVTPHEGIAFRGSLSRFRADNSILIRRPENFDVEPSLYAEDGRSREAGVLLNLAPVSFDVSAARFTNRGANPFEIHRVRARAGFDFPAKTKTGLIAEFAQDKYTEGSAAYSDFNARRFGLFVRYRP